MFVSADGEGSCLLCDGFRAKPCTTVGNGGDETSELGPCTDRWFLSGSSSSLNEDSGAVLCNFGVCCVGRSIICLDEGFDVSCLDALS